MKEALELPIPVEIMMVGHALGEVGSVLDEGLENPVLSSQSDSGGPEERRPSAVLNHSNGG